MLTVTPCAGQLRLRWLPPNTTASTFAFKRASTAHRLAMLQKELCSRAERRSNLQQVAQATFLRASADHVVAWRPCS